MKKQNNQEFYYFFKLNFRINRIKLSNLIGLIGYLRLIEILLIHGQIMLS